MDQGSWPGVCERSDWARFAQMIWLWRGHVTGHRKINSTGKINALPSRLNYPALIHMLMERTEITALQAANVFSDSKAGSVCRRYEEMGCETARGTPDLHVLCIQRRRKPHYSHVLPARMVKPGTMSQSLPDSPTLCSSGCGVFQPCGDGVMKDWIPFKPFSSSRRRWRIPSVHVCHTDITFHVCRYLTWRTTADIWGCS